MLFRVGVGEKTNLELPKSKRLSFGYFRNPIDYHLANVFRLIISSQAHPYKKFVDSVHHLGIDKAVPTTVLELMDV